MSDRAQLQVDYGDDYVIYDDEDEIDVCDGFSGNYDVPANLTLALLFRRTTPAMVASQPKTPHGLAVREDSLPSPVHSEAVAPNSPPKPR